MIMGAQRCDLSLSFVASDDGSCLMSKIIASRLFHLSMLSNAELRKSKARKKAMGTVPVSQELPPLHRLAI